MKSWNFLFAGFGGQGILFSGKVVAYVGLMEGRQVSWLPSYGPEMRGGTANCSVCISDEGIGSPLVLEPDVLAVMNAPSFDKFIGAVKPGGYVIVDSALIQQKTDRTDIKTVYIPATKLAQENGMAKLANQILMGALVRATGFADYQSVRKAVEKCVPASKQQLLELNYKAIDLGYNYKG